MKAAVYHQFGQPITIEKVPDPSPPEKGVVVKVEASGLCLSDWHGWMGHDPDIVLPHVPGHELSGTIAETGRGVLLWKRGQRVTVPFVGGCGSCIYCREGNQQVCDHQFQPGFTAWGSFAEYVAIDYADENLVELPEDLDFISAASLGCRFITAYRAVAAQAQLKAGQWFAVHGCGGVGLSAILIAKALGSNVIAIDIRDEKCELARTLGANYCINATNQPVIETIREVARGGVHVSMDALGHTETCLNSIKCLRKGGKHLQVGLLSSDNGNVTIPMSQLIAHELQLIGSHGMQAHQYPAMFKLLDSAEIKLSQLIFKTASLADVPLLLPGMMDTKSAGITVIDISECAD